MKVIITEAQLKRLPLLTEDIQSDAKMNYYKATYEKSKSGLNRLYNELTAINVHDIIFDPQQLTDLDTEASYLSEAVNELASILNDNINKVPEEVFYRDEEMYTNLRSTIDNLNNICYKKQSIIERIIYALKSASESLWDDDGKYDIYLKKHFTDIKSIDI